MDESYAPLLPPVELMFQSVSSCFHLADTVDFAMVQFNASMQPHRFSLSIMFHQFPLELFGVPRSRFDAYWWCLYDISYCYDHFASTWIYFNNDTVLELFPSIWYPWHSTECQKTWARPNKRTSWICLSSISWSWGDGDIIANSRDFWRGMTLA